MGISKTKEFTVVQNRKAKLYKALGHPARIAILEFLIDEKACVCSDIVDHLPLSQSTISQHLKELKSAEIMKSHVVVLEVVVQLIMPFLLKIILN